MSSKLTSSQGLVLATAMAVSAGTIIIFDRCREKHLSYFQIREKQVLKSCLASSGNKKRVKNKKRVQFAEDVKDSEGNSEAYRKQHRKRDETPSSSCMNEAVGCKGMPANRAALYNGILRDRVHRTGYSY